MNVKEVMGKAVSLGACQKSGKATDWKSLSWLFFSPQGREFCKDKGFPSIEMFRDIQEGLRPYGIHVEENLSCENKDVGLIGNCEGNFEFSGTKKVYKVVLMHGAKAVIRLKEYAVVLVENISGEYQVLNDGTGKIL